MTPVWDLLLLSVPDTHESRDMRRLSLRSVASGGREGEGRGEDLRGGKGGSELESALVLSLLCRVRMPESLAGNHLTARAIRQGRTGEGEGGGVEGKGPFGTRKAWGRSRYYDRVAELQVRPR